MACNVVVGVLAYCYLSTPLNPCAMVLSDAPYPRLARPDDVMRKLRCLELQALQALHAAPSIQVGLGAPYCTCCFRYCRADPF